MLVIVVINVSVGFFSLRAESVSVSVSVSVFGFGSDPIGFCGSYRCQGDDYYEDAQGGIICKYCGIQSQDYIAESHEAFEEGMVTAQSQGHSIRRHTFVGSKQKVKKKQFEPELLDYLLVYQYALQMICNSAFRLIIGAEGSQDSSQYSQTLKDLWIKYLEAWRNADSSCQISFAFQREGACNCKSEKFNHPVFPTKPLLLGFLYLVIRMHRLDIIIADIIRWIERGLIPYMSLWDCLPENYQRKIQKSYRKAFTIQHNHNYGSITPMNIWFHTCTLAESLEIELPPLNGPLIGFAIIKSLGLPEEVRINFTKITHLFTTAVPLDKADIIHEHYIEYIATLVLLACFMTNDWLQWNLLKIQEFHVIPEKTIISSQTTSKSGKKKQTNSDSEEEEEGSDEDSYFHEGNLSQQKTHKNPDTEDTHSSSSSSSRGILPCLPSLTHEIQLNSFLSRNYLQTYLQQLQRTLPKEMKKMNDFQETLHSIFSSLSFEEKESLQYFQRNTIITSTTTTINSNAAYCQEILMNPMYLSSEYIFHNNLKKEDEMDGLFHLFMMKKKYFFNHNIDISNPNLLPKEDRNMKLKELAKKRKRRKEIQEEAERKQRKEERQRKKMMKMKKKKQQQQQDQANNEEKTYKHRSILTKSAVTEPDHSTGTRTARAAAASRLKKSTTLPRPEDFQNVYLSCIRGTMIYQDTTGRPLLQYSYLLERFAAYFYLSPILLHTLLSNYELQMIELIFYGKIISKMNQNSLLQNNLIIKEQKKLDEKYAKERYDSYCRNIATSSAEQKELKKFENYLEKSKVNFPLINRLIELDGKKKKMMKKNKQQEQVEQHRSDLAEETKTREDEEEGIEGEVREGEKEQTEEKKTPLPRRRVKIFAGYELDENEDWWTAPAHHTSHGQGTMEGEEDDPAVAGDEMMEVDKESDSDGDASTITEAEKDTRIQMDQEDDAFPLLDDDEDDDDDDINDEDDYEGEDIHPGGNNNYHNHHNHPSTDDGEESSRDVKEMDLRTLIRLHGTGPAFTLGPAGSLFSSNNNKNNNNNNHHHAQKAGPNGETDEDDDELEKLFPGQFYSQQQQEGQQR